MGGLDNLFFDLPIPQFEKLRAWWSSTGENAQVRALSSEKTSPGATSKSGSLAEFELEASKLQADQQLYWNAKAYFSFCRTKAKGGDPIPLWYEACPECNRKLLAGECAKCMKKPNPVLRYLMSSIKIEDYSADRWAGAFDESGMALLGCKAEKFKADCGGDPEQVDKKLQQAFYAKEYTMRLRASVDVYEGTARVRTNIMNVSPVDRASDGAAQLEQIKDLYPGASPEAQLEVKDLLASWAGLQENGQVAASWQTGLDNLTAVAAC